MCVLSIKRQGVWQLQHMAEEGIKPVIDLVSAEGRKRKTSGWKNTKERLFVCMHTDRRTLTRTSLDKEDWRNQ